MSIKPISTTETVSPIKVMVSKVVETVTGIAIMLSIVGLIGCADSLATYLVP